MQVFQNDTVNFAACVDPLKIQDGSAEMEVEPTVEDKTGESWQASVNKTIVTRQQNSFWNSSQVVCWCFVRL